MPFPTGTFTEFLRSASMWVEQEFESLYAQLTGFLSVEHHDDGTHSDLTADTVTTPELSADAIEATTLTAPKSAVATGPLVRVGLCPVSINGALGAAGSAAVTFVYGGQTYVIAMAQNAIGTPGTDLAIMDATSLKTILVIGKRGPTGGAGTYFIAPDGAHAGAAAVYLGDRAASNTRFAEVAAQSLYGHNGFQERSRTTALGVWTAYTPTWASAGTQPAIGNGTIAGSYTLVGKTCHFIVTLTAGSTTTFGTGTWTFSLPVTAVSGTPVLGGCYLSDSGSPYPGVTRQASTTEAWAVTALPGGFADATTPFAWGSGDTLRLQGTYEIA